MPYYAIFRKAYHSLCSFPWLKRAGCFSSSAFLEFGNNRKCTGIRFIRMAASSKLDHYSDVLMGTVASQITSLTIVYSTVYSGADKRKHQSSASLAFVRVIHRSTVNFPHKGPVTRKMFPFDDVIMTVYHVVLNFVIVVPFPTSYKVNIRLSTT